LLIPLGLGLYSLYLSSFYTVQQEHWINKSTYNIPHTLGKGPGCWTSYRAHGGGATPEPPWSAHQTCQPWQLALHPTQETERRGAEWALLTLLNENHLK